MYHGSRVIHFDLPRSTVRILRHKMERQIQLAGDASQAVLHHAADSFSESAYVYPVSEMAAQTQSQPQQSTTEQTTSPTKVTVLLDLIKTSLRENIALSRRPWRIQRGTTKGGTNNDINDRIQTIIDEDEALEKYESAIKEWRVIKTQLNNIRYDPFNLGTPDHLLTNFRTEMNNTLARALRIQNTVILIDGIVRNDPPHNFSKVHINLFAQVGTLIRQMLVVPVMQHKRDCSNEQAYTELKTKLTQIRSNIIELSSIVATSSSQGMPAHFLTSKLDLPRMMMMNDEAANSKRGLPEQEAQQDLPHHFQQHQNDDDDDFILNDESLQDQDDMGGRGAPKFVHGNRLCALLFLQLVEHLALRSVRLYQTWKQCEKVCNACEKRDLEQRSMRSPLMGSRRK